MKGKSIDKRPKVTPVILVDESQELTNTVIISKMISNPVEKQPSKPSSNVFAGGFKYRPQQQKANPNISNYNPSKIDKMTVYDEFGIMNDSIGKKKYRDDKNSRDMPRQPQKPTTFENSIRPLSGGNPWKKQEKGPISNNYMDSGYYQISKLKEREQSAVHVKSSLQVINLENIEAKLEVHRQTLKPIEDQYNILKGKAVIEPQYKQKLRFNIDVDREYEEIQPTRVYELIKEGQNKQEKPYEDQVLQDMWEQRKRKDPKLAEYDFQYQQYLVEKEAKKMIGSVVKNSLFNWDKYAKKDDLDKRKVAKQHKSKQKSYGEAVQQKAIDKNKSSISPSKLNRQEEAQESEGGSIQERIASKDDKFIGKFIMAQIDVDKRGTISKDQLVDYISTKDHLIKGYHIDLKWLHTDLDNFETKRKGMLNQQQIVQFLATLNSLHHPAMIVKEIPKGEKGKKQMPMLIYSQKQSEKVYTTYFKQNSSKFQRIFNFLDLSDDKIIKRQEFIENIILDAECSKILDRNAIVFNAIGKSITFRQILSFILDDYRKQRNQRLKKSKQYITLQRFSQYFEVPESLDLSLIDRTHNDKLKREATSTEIQMFDIEQEYLIILKDIFDTIPRIYQNYIVVNDFVGVAFKDPQILALSDELCRIQSIQTKIPVQTIKSTLMRLRKECDEYGTWEIVKTYFSRRGRPLDWDFDLIQKKKELRGQKLKERASTIKNISAMDGQFATSKPVFELSSKLRSQKKNASLEKYTIPKPFNITDERKKQEKSANKPSSEELQIQQLKNKFKAKPVNAEILQPKPELIQGKLKPAQKSNVYNYENYENDRIERVLKRAQEQFEQAEKLKEIKKMAEVKASSVKIDMGKKLEDIVKEQKKINEKTKPKPTVPQANPNLYPENPKQEAKKKLEKYKTKLEKQEQAAQVRESLKNDIKERAKERNKQVLETAKEKKRRQQQEKDQLAKLEDNSYKPKINKRNTTQQQKQALKRAREERQRKKLEQQEAIMQQLQKKKKEKLSFIKQQSKLQLAGLEDDEILSKIDEVDLEDLLLDQDDKASFRKQFQLKGKTRKEIKERFNGQAGRQRAAMQAEEKRIADDKRQMKERKQSKIVKEKIEEAKQLKNQVTTTLNVDTNFHRSNALRRYRAIMEGKEPNSQYDLYSRMGQVQENEI